MTKNESCCTNMMQKCSFEVSVWHNLYKNNFYRKLFLSISSFNLDFFCYFCTWFPLSYLIGRCTTPVRQPNSKGSIEVHAMLKHAMVTHQMLKRVLGGRSPYLWKGVCMRFSFYTPNFEHLDYSVERLATADVPGCDYSHPLMCIQ